MITEDTNGRLRYAGLPAGVLDKLKAETKINALGQPAPGRTDFKDWPRDALERFARQAADENLILEANNKELLRVWREVMVKGHGMYALSATEDGKITLEAILYER